MPAKKNSAKSDELNAALHVGIVVTICSLKKRGMSVRSIASRYEDIAKLCGKEMIRASGVNGGAKVADIEAHMRKFGVTVAKELAAPKRSPDD